MIEPTLIYIAEPKLTFGYNQEMEDPRDGLTLFGPYTRDLYNGSINIGIIGPEKQRKFVLDYLKLIQRPVLNPEPDVARPYFPGLEAAFGIDINFAAVQQIDVKEKDINKYLKYTDSHQRVFNLCNLYSDLLNQYSNEEPAPVNVWFVAIPDDIYKFSRPKSRILKAEDNITISLSSKDRNTNQGFLFDEMTDLKEAYDFEINFHNQLKAKVLPNRIVTQIIRESTVAYDTIWTDLKKVQYEKMFDGPKAWNIATTLYYKYGGIPWKLGAVRKKVCYLGLVYKKIDQAPGNKNACCAAQMFLDSGDGMVFKGNIGPWYNPQTKEFHLSEKDAFDLLSLSLEAFRAKSNLYPEEIFIHAKTYFDDDEWAGFIQAADKKSKIVGIRIRNDNSFKLYRDQPYCVPRGTTLLYTEHLAYLWTKGYIPRLQTQLGLETPNPLSVEISRGAHNIQTVCQDILALTKLNYNACIFADGLPVTLRFADTIGEILTAGKNVKSEVLPF